MLQQSVTHYVLIVWLIDLDSVLAVISIHEATPLEKAPIKDSLNAVH